MRRYRPRKYTKYDPQALPCLSAFQLGQRERGAHASLSPLEIHKMAVMVNQNSDSYNAHRIVLPDGSAFKFSDIKKIQHLDYLRE